MFVAVQKVTSSCFINNCRSSLRSRLQVVGNPTLRFRDTVHGYSSTLTRIRAINPEISCREISSGCAARHRVETPLDTKLSGEIRDDGDEESGTLAARSGQHTRRATDIFPIDIRTQRFAWDSPTRLSIECDGYRFAETTTYGQALAQVPDGCAGATRVSGLVIR